MELEPTGQRRAGASFAEHLEEAGPKLSPAAAESRPNDAPAMDALRAAVHSLGQGQAFIERAVRRAGRGGGEGLEPAQLLALQTGVYRYTQELELASKLVDKATGAIKQTLQSQQ